jgi:hypothetical protein
MNARGILRWHMYCVIGKNMCSGWINENLCQRKVVKIKNEILHDTSSNEVIAPILQHIEVPISLQKLWRLVQYLPTFTGKKRDDHIFGAARCIANTVGVSILDAHSSDLIDQPLPHSQKK